MSGPTEIVSRRRFALFKYCLAGGGGVMKIPILVCYDHFFKEKFTVIIVVKSFCTRNGLKFLKFIVFWLRLKICKYLYIMFEIDFP